MISVCIVTKNSSASLKETLLALQDFSEVVILDNGSSDDTIEIAKAFPNVRVYTSPFIGFGPLRNLAASLAKQDWILALDSDEVMPEKLIQEILSLPLERGSAYSLERSNFYAGKQIKGCGWDRDRVVRLYHRQDTQYDDAAVHEAVCTKELQIIPLAAPLFHTPYRSTSDFLSKMQHYSSLFAKQHRGKRKSSFGKALSRALFTFFRSYILQKGMFLGKEGFIISLYNANTVFYKYLKLQEKNQFPAER
ncbi:MAG: glycosyltransferase family 2 protein [Chlamydiae bacterium]|nr:glycosyltransferase family 2 protein [Chlamydiota bacterium]